MKLSICMMVKDEEINLDRCLSSLEKIRKEIDSELIIVDTGSSDRTVEIAKKYTDKVFFHKWNNDFSDMRNITISYASGEWIFILDADEEIVDDEYLIELFQGDLLFKFNTINLYTRSFKTNRKNSSYSGGISSRIFKNDGFFRYDGRVHNQPKFKEPIGTIDTQIYHYGYNSEDKELMEKKFKRTASILKEELEKNPKDIYYNYQLSVSYAMYEKWELGYEQIIIAVQHSRENARLKKKKLNIEGDVYAQLGICAMKLNKTKEAIMLMEEVKEEYATQLDFNFALGNLYLIEGRQEEAYVFFIRYMEIINNYEVGNIGINNQFDKNETIGFKLGMMERIFLMGIKRKDITENLYLKFKNTILREKYISDRIIILITRFLLKIKDFKTLKTIYEIDFKKYYLDIENAIEDFIDEEDLKKISILFGGKNSKYQVFNQVRLNILNKEEVDMQLIEKLKILEGNKRLESHCFIMTLGKDEIISEQLFKEIDEVDLILEIQKIEESQSIEKLILFFKRNLKIKNISKLKMIKDVSERLIAREIYFNESTSKQDIFENIIKPLSKNIVNRLENINLNKWEIVNISFLESYIITNGIDSKIMSLKSDIFKNLLISYISKYKDVLSGLVEILVQQFYSNLEEVNIEKNEIELAFLEVILSQEEGVEEYLFNRYVYILVYKLINIHDRELIELCDYMDDKSDNYFTIELIKYIEDKGTRYKRLKRLIEIKPEHKEYIKNMIEFEKERVDKVENEEIKALKTMFIRNIENLSDKRQIEQYLKEYMTIFGIDREIFSYIIINKKNKEEAFKFLYKNIFILDNIDEIFELSKAIENM